MDRTSAIGWSTSSSRFAQTDHRPDDRLFLEDALLEPVLLRRGTGETGVEAHDGESRKGEAMIRYCHN
jgi:hypothetical protein